MQVLQGVPGVSFTFFSPKDVVRHALVQSIVEAYQAHEAADRSEGGSGQGADEAQEPGRQS
jgi:phosphate starvation-inducible PhoH-like protein